MLSVGALFLLGVTSGLHCLGMCGPIVLALQAPLFQDRRWAGNLAFNLGRITTYTAVGTVLFLVASQASSRLPIENARQGLTLFVGIFLILLGAGQFLPFRILDRVSPERIPGFSKIRWSAFGRGGLPRIYALGLLLGLIPCGMTYAMYARVLDSDNTAVALAGSLAFGAGTLPWLLMVGVFSNYLVGGLRRWGEILSALVMIALGAERVYRALTVAATCCQHGS